MRTLCVVARRPEAGRSKTRLCPPLQPVQAATLYSAFLRDVLVTMRRVPDVEYVIAHAEADAADYFVALAPDMRRVVQRGADLGARLAAIVADEFAAAATAVAVLSSDSPNLPAEFLSAAFARLDEGYDAVFGPCDDGGYYLGAVRAPHLPLFTTPTMSSATTLAETLALAETLRLRVALLPHWYDVDYVADLERLHADLAREDGRAAPHTWAMLSELEL